MFPLSVFHRDPLCSRGRFSNLALVVNVLDSLLDDFKGREEDGVDGAGPDHGDAQAAVHVSLKEFDLGGRLDFLSARVQKGVSLVNALC